MGTSRSNAFDLEESFRRAEAARGMSMDVSHVPGVESWPVDALMSGEPFSQQHFQVVYSRTAQLTSVKRSPSAAVSCFLLLPKYWQR